MSRTPPQEPRGRLSGPTASLRPALVVDNRMVYGGRVIAESEEEYATQRAILMKQGQAKTGPIGGTGVASVDVRGQVNRFGGILQGNAAPHQFPPPHAGEPFARYPGHDPGRVVLMPGDMEGIDPGGLVRSIGDRSAYHLSMRSLPHQGLDAVMRHDGQRVAMDYHRKQSLSPTMVVPQSLQHQRRIPCPPTPSHVGVRMHPHGARKAEMERRHWERRSIGGDLAATHRRIHFQLAGNKLDRNRHKGYLQRGDLPSGVVQGGGDAGFGGVPPLGNSQLPAALHLQEMVREYQKPGMVLPGNALHSPQSPAMPPHLVMKDPAEQGKSMKSFTALLNEVDDSHNASNGPSPGDNDSRVRVSAGELEGGIRSQAPNTCYPNLLDGYRGVNLPISIPLTNRAYLPACPEYPKCGNHYGAPPPQLPPLPLHSGNFRMSHSSMIRGHPGQTDMRICELRPPGGVWPMKTPAVGTQRGGSSGQVPVWEEKDSGGKTGTEVLPQPPHQEVLENDDMLRSPFGQTLGTEDLFGDGFGLGGDMRSSHDFHSHGMNEGEDDDSSREKTFKADDDLEEDVPSSLQDVCNGLADVVSKSMPAPFTTGMQSVDQWKEEFPGMEALPVSLKTGNDLWDLEEDSPLGLTLEELQEVTNIEAQQNTDGEMVEEILDEVDDEEETRDIAEDSAEQAINQIEDIDMGEVEMEGGTESAECDEESEATTETEGDNAILSNPVSQGQIGIKCPRVFSQEELLPQPGRTRASRGPPRCKKTPGMQQSTPSKVCKSSALESRQAVTSETNELFSGAGIGFDEDEPRLCPKSLPRFPKRMAINQNDVLELAFCVIGKPTSTAHEIQEICKWWLQQAETQTLQANRTNVLKNWPGLQMARSFSDGARGIQAIQDSMARDGRFFECGMGCGGQEVWGCRRFGGTLDDSPSDADDKAMFWLGEPEDYDVEIEEECIPDVVEREKLAYQKAAKDESSRRKKLRGLQDRLKLRQPVNARNVEVSIPRVKKRRASWAMLPALATAKDLKSRKPTKHKSRSLLDVYTYGPRNVISGDDSSISPFSDLSAPIGQVSGKTTKQNEKSDDPDKRQARKNGMGYGEWVGRCQNSYLAGVCLDDILSAAAFRDVLTKEEKAGLLRLLPECDREMLTCGDHCDLFKSPQLQEAMARYGALLEGGLLEPESNMKWFPTKGRGAEARMAREDAIRIELGSRFGEKATDDFLRHNVTLPDLLLGLYE